MNWSKGAALPVVMLTGGDNAQAHYSYALADTTMQPSMAGTVRMLEWACPRVRLWIESPDGKGGSETSGFETMSPAQLQRDYGSEKNVVHTSNKITVLFAPLRSGQNGGELEKVTLENGQVPATRFTANGSQPNSTGPDTINYGRLIVNCDPLEDILRNRWARTVA